MNLLFAILAFTILVVENVSGVTATLLQKGSEMELGQFDEHLQAIYQRIHRGTEEGRMKL